MIFKVQLKWWPVGQGLFASGIIKSRQHNPISWVYDCGTVSPQKLISTAITNYEKTCRSFGISSISLAVLSHFDRDHISGFTKLIKAFRIEKLLLPYLPLWQRLILAIEDGVTTNESFFDFFIDPVKYFCDLDDKIKEILFVQQCSLDDSADDSEGMVLDESGGSVEGLIEADYVNPPDDARDDPVIGTQRSTNIRFLKRGGCIRCLRLWEFVPYNDAAMAFSATPDFITKAQTLAQKLMDATTDRDKYLQDLKNHYENNFKNATQRNLISLFLYSGPIGNRLSLCRSMSTHPVRMPIERFSQIHTGDGTLKGNYWTRFKISTEKNAWRGRASSRLCIMVQRGTARTAWRITSSQW